MKHYIDIRLPEGPVSKRFMIVGILWLLLTVCTYKLQNNQQIFMPMPAVNEGSKFDIDHDLTELQKLYEDIKVKSEKEYRQNNSLGNKEDQDEFRKKFLKHAYENEEHNDTTIANNNEGRQTEEENQKYLKERGEEWKTILFWTSWFGKDWSRRYKQATPEELKIAGCPSWRCNFTRNRDNLESADAIVFSSTMVSQPNLPTFRHPEQRWVWVCVEAPRASPARISNRKVRSRSKLFNWTMTYHSNADVSAFYGHFRTIGEKAMPLRPNLMSAHPKAMKEYLKNRNKNITLEDIMGPSWADFVRRPKLVAWMSGHCGTYSKREKYVDELAKYVPVDKYGRCGKNPCPNQDGCWKDVLGPQYLFYLAFENDLCDEYITEKLYFPLVYNLVPVVWGGSEYDRFLPPGSYINGRHYHPKDLAALLLRLQNDPVEYGRYHVWRKFWDPVLRGSFCELCHKLHTDKTIKYYQDIPRWRSNNNQCKNPNLSF